MNFQDLTKIENADYYLDRAFKESKKVGEKVFRRVSGEKFVRIRKTEVEKIKAFNANIKGKMESIVTNFPSIDAMPEFYQELVRTTLDYNNLKKSLGAVNWVKDTCNILTRKYEHLLRRTKTEDQIKKLVREYYGRFSSMIKQINKNLKYLEESRQVMRTYPTLKTDLYTVSIIGFPNIGKSTLLSKLTTAKPEIKSYAFTTKGLNQGYASYGSRKIQFVDTPGVLNRDKRNAIEEQAYLILKYLTNLVVYVIDLTEPYPLKVQEQLLKELQEYEKPIIIYLSKADILDSKLIDKAKKKYKAVCDIENLNKRIEKKISEYYQ